MTSPEPFRQTEPQPVTALQLRDPNALQAINLRAATEEQADDGFDLKDLLRILLKHKWALLSAALLGLTVATVDGLTRTPMYRAAATLQIDQSTARIVQFNRDVDPYQDADGMTLQTQIELLRSRALAERVIDELGLDPARGRLTGLPAPALGASSTDAPAAAEPAAATPPELAAVRIPGLGMLTDLKDRVVMGYQRLGQPAVKDRAVLGREAVVGGFMGSVSIAQVPNSRLVRVSVASANPAHAARVANGIAKTFIAMNMERRSDSSGYAKNFLEDQIKATKAKLEESERALNSYARANSILMLDDKTNVVNQAFSDHSAALSKVEQERQRAEAVYNEVQRNPESAPQVLESKTVATYKEQRAKLESEYLTNLSTYKPEFPKMVQLRAQIAEMDARIKAEVGVVLVAVKAQFDAAKRQEEQVRARVGETRKEVLVSQDRGVQLNLLKRELDTNRQLYDGLLQRLKEVGVTGEVTANPISVVDLAATPLFPYEPDVRNIAMVGLMAGLLVGLAWAFIREHMDDSIKHSDEVEALFGVPLLGVIPQLTRKSAAKSRRDVSMQTIEDPRGSFAEAYRSMRTALQFSTAEGAPRQLMVTSSVQGEGKSTTAVALAINFAQLGKRVLLVDADMRNPSLHKALSMDNERGLSNYLSGEGSREQLIRPTEIEGLSLLTAGPTPPSPVDLLMGPKLLRLLEKAADMGFDQVVLDAPPLLGIADSIVLGNQIQSIVFVVKAGDTRKSSIKDALRRLRTAGLVPLGVALTRAPSHHTSYYGHDSYYGYGYGKPAAVTAGGASPAVAEEGTRS